MREALRAKAAVVTLFLSTEHPDASEVVAEAAATDTSVVWATPAVVAALSDAATPQGVVAVVEMEDVAVSDLAGLASLVLVLHQVRDPGNAGTLVRCAAAAGAEAVVFTRGSVDPYSPKTVRAAAGTLYRVDVVRDAALDGVAEQLGEHGFALVGTDAAAPLAYDEVDYTGPVAFVVGNEAWGIPPDDKERLSEVVSIPMPGHAESLNAAMAGAILLFEAVRQRRGRHGSAEGGRGNPFGGTAD